MKIVTSSNGKKKLTMSHEEWLGIAEKAGWLKPDDPLIVEAKKKKKFKHSPKEHGFIDECIKKNKGKDDPGAYCASIVDKVKGRTDWRKGPKKKD